MSFGKDESVAVGPVWVCRIVTKSVEKQCDQNFNCGQGTSGMSGLGSADHLDDLIHFRLRLLQQRILERPRCLLLIVLRHLLIVVIDERAEQIKRKRT